MKSGRDLKQAWMPSLGGNGLVPHLRQPDRERSNIVDCSSSKLIGRIVHPSQ